MKSSFSLLLLSVVFCLHLVWLVLNGLILECMSPKNRKKNHVSFFIFNSTQITGNLTYLWKITTNSSWGFSLLTLLFVEKMTCLHAFVINWRCWLVEWKTLKGFITIDSETIDKSRTINIIPEFNGPCWIVIYKYLHA